MESKQKIQNSTTVLVLGILSIVFGCFFVGAVLGIIGLVLGGKAKKLYKENPDIYEGYGALNAGWIMSIIGTILGGLYIIYWTIWVLILGGAALSMSSLH
jgi:hypothetical protein